MERGCDRARDRGDVSAVGEDKLKIAGTNLLRALNVCRHAHLQFADGEVTLHCLLLQRRIEGLGKHSFRVGVDGLDPVG